MAFPWPDKPSGVVQSAETLKRPLPTHSVVAVGVHGAKLVPPTITVCEVLESPSALETVSVTV